MRGKWHNYLNGAHFSIATMHSKERVVAPLFKKEFDAVARVPLQINTDLLGTFTGEIKREGDMIAVARKKCLMAMELTGLDYGLASEGSFGPHPELGYIPSSMECMLFNDRKNGVEVFENMLTTETNFMGKYIESQDELANFAKAAGFPSHALVLRNSREKFTFIHKGLHEEIQVQLYFKPLHNQFGKVFVETDMRAMHNPTRMKMIEKVTQKLIAKIKSACPGCGAPGYGVSDAIAGLPCKICRTPTRSTLAQICECRYCGHRQEKMYPHKKQFEDPMYCNSCNP